MAKLSPEKNSEAIVKNEEAKKAKRSAKIAKNDVVKPQPTTAKNAPKGKKANTQPKPKLHKRIAKTFKEMISELKKVTWPKWKTVLTSTTVVIVVVLFFLIVLTAMDFGLVRLLRMLTEKAVG